MLVTKDCGACPNKSVVWMVSPALIVVVKRADTSPPFVYIDLPYNSQIFLKRLCHEIFYTIFAVPLIHLQHCYTVWKVISSNWQCQNVSLSITDMFVIEHKENVSLINHKMFLIKQWLFSLCYITDFSVTI